MQIILNGAPHQVSSPCTVAQLVEELGYAGKRIAVERNGEIVVRSEYESTQLDDGDQVEIVVAVGGG